MTEEIALCQLCGEPMPPGEEMFKYHGHSGDCPKPPLPKPVSIMDDMFELLREALNKQYADRLPTGFYIYKLAEYTQETFPAPNLWLEKKQKPEARYLCIISDDSTASIPALGKTVNDAIAAAIAKQESWGATKQ